LVWWGGHARRQLASSGPFFRWANAVLERQSKLPKMYWPPAIFPAPQLEGDNKTGMRKL
jgi:hypothetical protein